MSEARALRAAGGQSSHSPFISVITATLNAAALLHFTIDSLRAQTFLDFEWIVVDGASTDATVNLLRGCDDVVTVLISEPDAGIYDAWNKACGQACGEWLLFLGAGDELASADTLEMCAAHLRVVGPSMTLVYGRQVLLSPQTRSVIGVFGAPWEAIRGKWEIGRPALPPHGATFHRKALFVDASPFDLRFPIAADSHFLLRNIRQCPPAFMPRDVTRSPLGGVSLRLDTARKVGREIAAINRDLGLRPPFWHRLGDILRLVVISVVSVLRPSVAHGIADLARRIIGKSARWTPP